MQIHRSGRQRKTRSRCLHQIHNLEQQPFLNLEEIRPVARSCVREQFYFQRRFTKTKESNSNRGLLDIAGVAQQFIETCQEWIVPYIGDLVAVSGLHDFPNAPFSNRAWA